MSRSLRDRLLLQLRPNLWRSLAQLCLAIAGRRRDDAVEQEVELMRQEGLVDWWDTSWCRYQLTIAGRNAAADALKKKGKAA